jgi:hypothetical protein
VEGVENMKYLLMILLIILVCFIIYYDSKIFTLNNEIEYLNYRIETLESQIPFNDIPGNKWITLNTSDTLTTIYAKSFKFGDVVVIDDGNRLTLATPENILKNDIIGVVVSDSQIIYQEQN